MNNLLYLVIPCYNEEEVIPTTAKTLHNVMKKMIKNKKISEKSKIFFVDDGSTDQTWNIICSLNKNNTIFTGIKLSRNRGQQNAVLAGLLSAKNKSDFVISIASDLQDDVNVIEEMVDKYTEGYEIVYGVRTDRSCNTFMKRFTAETYFKIMNKLNSNIVFNHSDFRLTSKRVIEYLEHFKEVNLFIRGIIPIIGFKSTKVFEVYKERKQGKAKYTTIKLIELAITGITSFSVIPLRIISYLGLISILLGVIMLFLYIFNVSTLELTSLWIICGLILTSMGIIGEYVGKTFIETKQRPRFIIDQDLESKNIYIDRH